MPRLRQPKEQAPPASARFELKDEPENKGPKEEFEREDEENPEVIVAEAKEEIDAADDLKKQIVSLKRAEQEQRDRADKAERERKAAQERVHLITTEVEKVRTEHTQSRAEVINTAIAKESEGAEAAERDLEAALSSGDASLAAKAQRRLAQAESKLAILQSGKSAIEAEIEDAKNRPAPKQEEPQGDALDKTNLPDTAKRWLRSHPDYLSDARKNAKIQSLHWDVVDEGHAPFSDDYYVSLETHLGMRKAAKEEVEEEHSSGMVSAPVSREPPAGDGTRKSGVVKLSMAQREAAKMAGITEVEYAKQLQKLQAEKDSGNYREGR